MFIKQVQLNNFRCFTNKKLDFSSNIVLIEGPNGIGKTTLLEALHYACYLRSFRTHTPRDLMQFEQENFFIKVVFEHIELERNTTSNLQVGFSGKKRLVKLNDKAVHSYKELMDHYRIITLTEDDLGLIKLGPDVRRQFIDQAILLYNPSYIQQLKEYKTIVDNRNKLLQAMRVNKDMYTVWTEQLWHKTNIIQNERVAFLHQLQQEVELMLKAYFPYDVHINFTYKPKKTGGISTLEDFFKVNSNLFETEKRFGRSLFGAHLDDFAITFQGNASRMFASRGQQKLIMLLVKIAQIKALSRQKGPAIFLLDDFMTDFDHDRAQIVIKALTDLKGQLIFTAPIKSSILADMLLEKGAQRIEFSI